jgi:hypothetical protein
MKLRKGPKSPIIPIGDFEKVQSADEEKAFYENPLIPWWVKLNHSLRPGPRKQTRTETWCKRCGRKHSKREECEHLRLVEDLTAPSTKVDELGKPIPNRKVGFYTTRPKEAVVA